MSEVLQTLWNTIEDRKHNPPPGSYTVKLFEAGRISSGLAAKLAGMSRVAFLCQCGQYGVSVFQQNPEELHSDLEAAFNARRG